jgi:hypothetical protein
MALVRDNGKCCAATPDGHSTRNHKQSQNEIAGIPLARSLQASRTINQNQSMKSLPRRKQHRHHCTYQYLTTTMHFCETTTRGTITPGLKVLALKDAKPQSICSDDKSGTAL